MLVKAPTLVWTTDANRLCAWFISAIESPSWYR